jgi:hypothetical protein
MKIELASSYHPNDFTNQSLYYEGALVTRVILRELDPLDRGRILRLLPTLG